MDHDISVVQEKPAGIGGALVMVRCDAFLLEAGLNLVTDGFQLWLALSGADNEVVRKAADIACIQEQDIVGEFRAGRLNGKAGNLYTVQSRLPPVNPTLEL